MGVISTYKHLVLETPDTRKDWNTAVPLWYLCGNCRGMAIKDEVAKEALRIIRGGRMRELKFRVWNKTMHQYRHFVLQKGVTVSIGADLIIEQYTGLKDKNGKEIYEGDIVKRTKMHGILRNVEEIEIFRIRWGVRKAGFFAYNKKRAKHGMSAKRLFAEDTYEVIGNIHENPELVEEK